MQCAFAITPYRLRKMGSRIAIRDSGPRPPWENMDIIEMVASLHKVIEFGDFSDEAVMQAKELLGDFEQITYKETGLEINEYI